MPRAAWSEEEYRVLTENLRNSPTKWISETVKETGRTQWAIRTRVNRIKNGQYPTPSPDLLELCQKATVFIEDRVNENGGFKQSRWTDEDTETLVNYVKEYGTKNLEPVAQKLNRTMGSVRTRASSLKHRGKPTNVPAPTNVRTFRITLDDDTRISVVASSVVRALDVLNADMKASVIRAEEI